MDKTTIAVCPYLGSWRDPATAYGYPTGANACVAGDKPANADKEHQAQFCLVGNFSACPRLQPRKTVGHNGRSSGHL